MYFKILFMDLRILLEWNCSKVFSRECAFENTVCKISAILFRPHCARSHWKPKVVKMPNLFSMAAPQVVPVFSVSVSFSVWSWSRWLSMRLWSFQCIRNDNHIWSEVDYWYRDLLVSLLLAWINFSTVKWPIKWDTLMLMWHHSNTAPLLYSWIERKMHTRMCVPEIGICYSQGINKIVHPAEFGGSSIIYPYLSHYIWNQLLIRWWVFFFSFFCFFFSGDIWNSTWLAGYLWGLLFVKQERPTSISLKPGFEVPLPLTKIHAYCIGSGKEWLISKTCLSIILWFIIKSRRYTGGDFMFLYRFVRRHRRRPQILVHVITFEQLFGFLSFLVRLLALTCRLPD